MDIAPPQSGPFSELNSYQSHNYDSIQHLSSAKHTNSVSTEPEREILKLNNANAICWVPESEVLSRYPQIKLLIPDANLKILGIVDSYQFIPPFQVNQSFQNQRKLD